MTKPRNPRTIAARKGIAVDTSFGAVAPPIHLSTTYVFPEFERAGTHDYSRTSNPTRSLLAETLAELEGGEGAVVTSSGMAAVDLATSQLRAFDLLVAPHDCYGGTHRLLSARRDMKHFDVMFVDQGNPEHMEEAFSASPTMIFIETPSNPLMRVVDIRAIAERARRAGAKIAVDNTFLSPALQRPLALGVDYVIHSTTKYLNGHSDVVGGAVVCAKKSEADIFAAWANIVGTTGSAFDAYLTLRGIRTLFPRIAQQQQSALAIARHLAKSASVERVHYPGLPSHPGHTIAKAQQSGFGAMLSFELAGGGEAARRFVETVRIFTLAESLGGVESLVAHPATMTHAGMDADARQAAGITDGLLRLSVGLEAEEDLIEDLEAALAASRPARPLRKKRA
ncbi:cystathionine gamma-synthase [Hyphomicrobium nitrativorans NL23]|uniref:L-methionine gamma-lyase n=1 Tax=Hyphomicrobium nitrativorans NL23 TaxID=1029756 RepID=V5SD14_9HYPH|nr:cystathionine gamma-synthase [Hyphomicrobium nitrativorans]AHB48372.1 cystathionine gamma-synthase [Hyphomicrobium nitrativorans NL23]